MFEPTLAEAKQVIKGPDATKLSYKLTSIQFKHELIRSETLADETYSTCSAGKEFLYNHVVQESMVTFKKGEKTSLNIEVTPQRRSLKGIFFLFIEP